MILTNCSTFFLFSLNTSFSEQIFHFIACWVTFIIQSSVWQIIVKNYSESITYISTFHSDMSCSGNNSKYPSTIYDFTKPLLWYENSWWFLKTFSAGHFMCLKKILNVIFVNTFTASPAPLGCPNKTLASQSLSSSNRVLSSHMVWEEIVWSLKAKCVTNCPENL